MQLECKLCIPLRAATVCSLSAGGKLSYCLHSHLMLQAFLDTLVVHEDVQLCVPEVGAELKAQSSMAVVLSAERGQDTPQPRILPSA